MKSFLQNAALFVLSCLIALGGIEVGLRIWGPDVLAMGNQFVFNRFDPVLGWDNLENAEGRFTRSEFSYVVKINSDGLFDAEVKPKAPGEFRVAALGDSFTWGHGVPYGQRFTEVIEARQPNINVLNFGVSGFSPIQYLLELDRVLSFKPDYVLIAFCLGNDISDNLAYTPYDHPKPYGALSADGEHLVIKGHPLPHVQDTGLFLIGATSHLRLVGMMKVAYTAMTHPKARTEETSGLDELLPYVPTEKLAPNEAKLVNGAYKVNELIFAEIKKKIDSALGPGRLAVLLVPTTAEVGLYRVRAEEAPNVVGDRVSAGLGRLGIPVVDGRGVIGVKDFWNKDGHWRPSGHAKIGELLATYLSNVRRTPTVAIEAPASAK